SVAVGDCRSAADDDAAEKDREELKRLLYVAVTRARDRLYLATSLDADGRFTALRGGLGDVLPPEVRALFETAATGVDRVEWQGSTARHEFVVVPPAGEERPEPMRADVPAAVAADFAPLEPASGIRRRRI